MFCLAADVVLRLLPLFFCWTVVVLEKHRACFFKTSGVLF
jgi:hypothetical protein